MTDILVIPDAHASPHHHNERFSILGKFIVDRQPDVIVNIGDFADMASLCSYDRGKRSFEGRRYKHDVAATIDAQEKLFAPMREYNALRKASKHKQYKPHLVLTLGNHENRINRATNLQPELDGVITTGDLKYEEFGWDVYDFLQPVEINGVWFSHYFTTGIMGKAISGEHPAHKLIMTQHKSCVQGHSHTRDFCERTAIDGSRVSGLIVGCFLDLDQHEDYAGPANEIWWRGVVMLHDVENGVYEPEFISMKQLRKMYETSR